MDSCHKYIINKQFKEYSKNIRTGSEILLDQEDVFLSYSKEDSNIHITALSELSHGCQHRLQLLCPYIQEYIKEYKPESFKIVVCLGDILKYQYKLPSICFSKKKDINSILIPNIDLFTGALYEFLKEVDKNDIPFESKEDTAMFIGSSTGPFFNNIRLKFCQLSQKTNNIKAYIHNVCQADKSEWIREYPDIESYIHSPISISDQLKHKITINIDGNTMCWSRLYWQMKSNSIPVYINKTSEDIQFFDYLDHSGAYLKCSLDNAIETIESIFNLSDEEIASLNQSGKKYTYLCFNDYIRAPHSFLQSIIDDTLIRLFKYDA